MLRVGICWGYRLMGADFSISTNVRTNFAMIGEISGKIQIWRQNRIFDFDRENDFQSIKTELYDKMTAETSFKRISNQFLFDRITKLYLG